MVPKNQTQQTKKSKRTTAKKAAKDTNQNNTATQSPKTSSPELIDPNSFSLDTQSDTQNQTKKGIMPKAILKPASILTRMLAFIFDILLIDLIIFSWFRPYLSNMVPTTGSWSDIMSTAQSQTLISPQLSGVIAIMALLMMAYFVFFEYVFSQTPGKLLFRLKTISASQLFNNLKEQQQSMEDIKKKVIQSHETVDIHKEMQNQQQQSAQNVSGQLKFSLTFWQALLRWIIFIPLFPFTLLIIADPIYLIFRKRRLTEVFSKTTVVEVLPPQSPLGQRLMKQMKEFRNR